MSIADSTQAVPQPTLRSQPDIGETDLLLIRHGRSADVVPGVSGGTNTMKLLRVEA